MVQSYLLKSHQQDHMIKCFNELNPVPLISNDFDCWGPYEDIGKKGVVKCDGR